MNYFRIIPVDVWDVEDENKSRLSAAATGSCKRPLDAVDLGMG